MATILVLYNQPADPAAFDEHYRSVHIPLVKKLPGLRSCRLSTGQVRAGQGEAPYHLIAEMVFDSMDDLRAALRSPEMQAAAADMAEIGSAGTTVLRYDTEEV
jgi:uncharacterized protein (TIGR02118 family)